MEINFSGNIVIEDDGNKIRSLFDGYWNVPDGVDINVQLRSLDNAPLPLSVEELGQLVGSFPAFSGAVALIDSQDALTAENAFETVRDERVVSVTVSDLEFNLNGSRIELSTEQLEELQAAEEAIGLKLFNGAITLDDASVTDGGGLPVDGRLELTASQVDLKLQTIQDEITNYITETEDNGSTSVFEQLQIIRDEIFDSITETEDNDNLSVVEKLNLLDQKVDDAKSDLEGQIDTTQSDLESYIDTTSTF